MRVLVGCEFSGHVRDAFIAVGHDAVSCDLVASKRPGPHLIGDVREFLGDGWDLGIFHPPCTYLSRVSAPRLAQDPSRMVKLLEGVALFRELLSAPIPCVAVENPVMLDVAQRLIGERASQFIEPFEHGHPFTKHTGLWLRNLPELVPTHLVAPVSSWVGLHRRVDRRNETFTGIASAMAAQWPGVASSPVPLF